MKLNSFTDFQKKELSSFLSSNDLSFEDIDWQKTYFAIERKNGKLVASAGVELHKSSGLLRSIAVDASARGKGVGGRITKTVLEYAKGKGIKEVYLLTTDVPDFFAKLGFMEIDREKVPEEIAILEQFKSICPQSAVCMKKKF